jgi:type II secretory pathway pseudopilin PulG
VRKLSRTSGFTTLELLLVIGIVGVLAAFSLPLVDQTIDSFRIVGASRSVTNAIAVAKIRAASTFTRVRLFVDLSTGTHKLQRLDKSTVPMSWVDDGGLTYLPTGVVFGFSSVTDPPDDSQVVIGQAPACEDDLGAAIGNTSCVIFNSRGVPVNTEGDPEGEYVLYITDDTAVFGVTVAPTGMIRLWRTYSLTTPNWVLQ